MTMQWIAGNTLGSDGSFTFSSIPQTFTHLQLRITGRSTFASTVASAFIRFNEDSGNNYYYHYLMGDGSVASSSSSGALTSVGFVGNFPGTSVASNIFASVVVDILDYTNTNKNKTVRSLEGFDANGSGQVYLASTLWSSTAAINQILLVSGGGANFLTGSRADLYGITTSELTGA